ncbi:MAG: hypothetical protein FJ139_05050 [Deltaproteobacteria bacterium]|nr:hypothetical protein [Deltaproteobacteria bacterium]
MPTKDFYERLNMLGYPMLERSPQQAANATLIDVAKSQDIRLWEGFPVMLANCIDKQWSNYTDIQRYIKSKKLATRVDSLITWSFALYKLLNVSSPQIDEFQKWYKPQEKNDFNYFLKKMTNHEDFMLSDKKMSSERTINTFKSYFGEKQFRLTEFLSEKDSYDLQYALSKIFPSGQKNLIMKKLRGEKLTKIEQEYFSRVVKKKIVALANPELHKLAQKLLS